MKFKKIELPFSVEGLEPYIDRETVVTHYEKHHTGYETKFNEGIKGTKLEKYDSIEDILRDFDNIPEELKAVTKNAGGGLYNHNIYWSQFVAERNLTKEEVGKLELIINSFGTKDAFIKELIDKGMAIFGSGWVWAVVNDGKVEITTTTNQENPLMYGAQEILLGIDVWEHAYYLKYKQDRKIYLENIINLLIVK